MTEKTAWFVRGWLLGFASGLSAGMLITMHLLLGRIW